MASEQPSERPTASLVASADHQSQDGFFKSAQWSADGTTVFTSSSTNTIDSYILPEDLLSPRHEPLSLSPQGTITLPEPTHAIAPSPYFSLQNPYTHLILTGAKDHPIQLHHAFPQQSSSSSSPSSSPSPPTQPPPLASYPLIHPPTETYQTPTSLLWPQPGTHFLAGTRNQISYFDTSRSGTGTGPLLRIPTIPSARHNLKGGGVGMRGTVSALSVQSSHADGAGAGAGTGLVAAGTWTRWLGLYDLLRAGECVATWGVKGAAAGEGGEDMNPGAVTGRGGIGGAGILQTLWSPCGRYLVVNERKSSGLLVYDVRVMGRLLGWLVGRDAETHQRLSCDVYPGGAEGGFEVWAGTRHGTVKVWEGLGNREGCLERSWDWSGHRSAVGSAAMHSCGSVVATCSGAWRLLDEEEEYEDGSDGGETLRPRTKIEESSLKIWSIKASSTTDVDYSPEA
ncbi:hypothetical protein BR93DRAFT_963504 [Coniochaeta sp. PMI_546]|nr:hypothetical protein BR93DRAFT_963504 [Coniochaeta sp. PMI_546]